jgi:CheY-like chemotaxis protein
VSKVVLIIDDDESIVSLLSLILDAEGYTVVTVTDSRQAVARILAVRPTVVVTDLFMPEVDGWALARQLKEMPETASIPLIGATADTKSLRRAREPEFHDLFARLITKPFDIDEVIHIIEELAPTFEGSRDLHESGSSLPRV